MIDMRVALYARVSTEDQARYGISIEAQLASLRKWAEDNGHEIVGEYVDAGISGKKPYKKRPELLRFMQQLEDSLKVDALVFTKLDRFFRSVKLYYQTMDVLDKHKVSWIAIQEDYETVTASGRMKVNIMLSVAENEADRTSERIKSVFEHKVILGEVISGALPLGLKIENKHIVPDENADAVKAVFEHYAAHGNKQAARDMLRDRYGITLPHLTISHMLHNELYKGCYRGNAEYCEAIIDPELWGQVQHDMQHRYVKHPPSGRVYLFSGLLNCGTCGKRFTVCTSGGTRIRYRCPGHAFEKICPQATSVSEKQVEDYLINYITDHVIGAEAELPQKTKKPPINKAAIEGKLNRLKELYVDGDITKEKYTEERDRLTAMLVDPPKPKQIKHKIIGKNFVEDYRKMSKEQQKVFWRTIIDHIDVDVERNLYIYFK